MALTRSSKFTSNKMCISFCINLLLPNWLLPGHVTTDRYFKYISQCKPLRVLPCGFLLR